MLASLQPFVPSDVFAAGYNNAVDDLIRRWTQVSEAAYTATVAATEGSEKGVNGGHGDVGFQILADEGKRTWLSSDTGDIRSDIEEGKIVTTSTNSKLGPIGGSTTELAALAKAASQAKEVGPELTRVAANIVWTGAAQSAYLSKHHVWLLQYAEAVAALSRASTIVAQAASRYEEVERTALMSWQEISF